MALYLHAIFSIITFILWSYITFTNPTKSGGFPCPCMKFTQNGPARLSHETHRMIPGYDHFCVWLNQVCASDTCLPAAAALYPLFGLHPPRDSARTVTIATPLLHPTIITRTLVDAITGLSIL